MADESQGVLYVVGTPIGNLEDLSARAQRTLATVDLVAAEDTRHTRGLLSNIGLKQTLIVYQQHNESRQTERLIDVLAEGKSVALVSDAGTPLISDPGLTLVAAALDAGIEVVGIPGPSALVTALSISGLPAERFIFEGFLPRRAAARRSHLETLRHEPRTMVFYEAVHRVVDTVADLEAIFGSDRRIALARELTKLHESLESGTLAQIAARLGDDIPLKGEFVLVVAGASEAAGGDVAEATRVFEILHAELPATSAAKLTAKITGISRNEVYRLTRACAD
ncbi:MAG: 16S rRNA (cytidine(1402)-2'-O)-methyltransferase [Gammaproteobacteria bacterium]|nr:16S rRNA (cytidine(1402)-2'-O)-methyltransferase [Gammaproteobacteria bacterium]